MTDRPPIRVLSLTHAEDHYLNAQQANAREIASRLDPARFEVTLLADGSGPASVAAAPAVRLLTLPARRKSLAILRRLLSGRQDLVLYPGPGLPEALFLPLPRWAPGRRARVVLPVEGDVGALDEVPARIRRRMRRVIRRADAVVPITDFVAQSLRDRFGRTGEVVPVGVDPQVFRPRAGPRAPGPMRVLCVGTVKAWKRPEYARIAAAALPEVRFAWLGAGEDLERQRAAAPPNLAFEGEVPRDALAERYRGADALLHPGRREGLPKVVLEALASGLPVVAFDDWRPRLLEGTPAAVVVRRPEEMVRALVDLRDDEAGRTARGAAARALALPYAWEAVAARWAAVFEREAALARGPRARPGPGARPG